MADVKVKESVLITPPNFQTAEFELRGNAPYVQLRFSEKQKNQMMEKHRAGSAAIKGRKKEARSFETEYEQATYRSDDGWYGIPASCFRNAMISMCKIVGFHMTKAKLTIFIEADGYDVIENIPLVRINGEPEMVIHHVRNATGVADLRVRAMWKKWDIILRIRFDADLFTISDITNLLARVGIQGGIGEGRPNGKTANGMGWGLFDIVK